MSLKLTSLIISNTLGKGKHFRSVKRETYNSCLPDFSQDFSRSEFTSKVAIFPCIDLQITHTDGAAVTPGTFLFFESTRMLKMAAPMGKLKLSKSERKLIKKQNKAKYTLYRHEGIESCERESVVHV